MRTSGRPYIFRLGGGGEGRAGVVGEYKSDALTANDVRHGRRSGPMMTWL